MSGPNKYGTWQKGIFAQYNPKYICDSCEKYPCSAGETKLMLSCPAYSPKPKLITNYDRLRAKSAEEMAEKIGESIDCEVCKTMHHSESGECPCRPHQSCFDFWLDWLKQEAQNEQNAD